jgi:triacylglycerol lipase
LATAKRWLIVFGDWLLLPPTLLIGYGFARALSGWVVLSVERAEPAQFGTKELATAAREGMSRAVLAVLRPLGASQPAPDVPLASDRNPPVLLLPEVGRNRSSLTFLASYLRSRGISSCWTVNHLTGERTLAEMAQGVAASVAHLREVTGAAQVDIVAHSTGGLLAAWYLKHLGGAEHVRRLVTLGCPWKGTRIAVFSRGRLAKEFLYGSPLLDLLAPPPIPTVSVWSPDDPAVIPTASALPNGVESVSIEGGGHAEMLLSARFYRAVHASLTHELAPVVPS